MLINDKTCCRGCLFCQLLVSMPIAMTSWRPSFHFGIRVEMIIKCQSGLVGACDCTMKECGTMANCSLRPKGKNRLSVFHRRLVYLAITLLKRLFGITPIITKFEVRIIFKFLTFVQRYKSILRFPGQLYRLSSEISVTSVSSK